VSRIVASSVAEGDGLHIPPFREDGVTDGTPTWIWSVVIGDALYARGYNGDSRRCQAAVRQRAGRPAAFIPDLADLPFYT
jgi:hypothetical protein